MRVALVSDWFPPRVGGMESQLLGLMYALEGLGHQVDVITSFPGEDQIGPHRIVRIPTRRLPMSYVALPVGLSGPLRSVLAPGRHDLVHVHLSSVTPFSFAALKHAALLGLPTAITMHSLSPGAVEFLKWMRKFGYFDPEKTPVSVVGPKLARQASRLVDGTEVTILSNGIDYGFWAENAEQSVNRQAGSFVISTVMRLEWTKRPWALARILRNLRDRGVDAQLEVAGSGTFRSSIMRQAQRLGVADHLALRGWKTPNDLRDILARSDVFLSPSTREAFGIAALEARAAGLPVVARSGTGISEFIRDGRDGIMCNSDRKMENALVELAARGSKLASMRGLRPELQRYDWPVIARRHLDFYELAGATPDLASAV